MKSETKKTKLLLGTVGGGGIPTPSTGEILIRLPALSVDAWAQIDIEIETGYAISGTPVRCLVPDGLPAEFLVGDAKVIEPGKIRVRICNNDIRPSAARNVWVRLLPLETRRPSPFPEISFPRMPEIKL